MQEVAVLAVDAGGSWCRAALCNSEGNVLHYALGGSCNYHSIGVAKATDTLTKVLAALMNNQALRVSCVVLGLAGLDTKSDYEILSVMVDNALTAANVVASQIYLENDAMLTLKGLVGRNSGVLLVAGTGSIACGSTQDGREARVGGWGYRIGDEGSGFAIGRAALTHILRAYDGREEPSGLCAAVLRKLSLADEDALLDWVYSAQFSVHQVAALTPIILRLAEANDKPASKIVAHASHELATMALTVVRRLDLLGAPFHLVLGGGVLQNAVIQRQLVALITSQCTEVEVIVPIYQSIAASLRYGLLLVGIDEDAILSRLSGQLDNPRVVSGLDYSAF